GGGRGDRSLRRNHVCPFVSGRRLVPKIALDTCYRNRSWAECQDIQCRYEYNLSSRAVVEASGQYEAGRIPPKRVAVRVYRWWSAIQMLRTTNAQSPRKTRTPTSAEPAIVAMSVEMSAMIAKVRKMARKMRCRARLRSSFMPANASRTAIAA